MDHQGKSLKRFPHLFTCRSFYTVTQHTGACEHRINLLKQPLPCLCVQNTLCSSLLVFVVLFLMEGIDFSSMAGCGLRVGRPAVGSAERPPAPAGRVGPNSDVYSLASLK